MTYFTKNEDGSVIYTAEQHAKMQSVIEGALCANGYSTALSAAVHWMAGGTLSAGQREKFKKAAACLPYIESSQVTYVAEFESALAKASRHANTPLMASMSNYTSLDPKKCLATDRLFSRLNEALVSGEYADAAVWLVKLNAVKAMLAQRVSSPLVNEIVVTMAVAQPTAEVPATEDADIEDASTPYAPMPVEVPESLRAEALRSISTFTTDSVVGTMSSSSGGWGALPPAPPPLPSGMRVYPYPMTGTVTLQPGDPVPPVSVEGIYRAEDVDGVDPDA